MFNLAHRLRRRTTTGNWIPEIDGLRCIALVAVLLFHMQGEIQRHQSFVVQERYRLLHHMLDAGHRGVALFFTISGYILGRPFAAHYLQGKQRPSLKKYYLRRITRLEPPYILNLLIAAGALFLLDHISWRFLVPHLLANILYLSRPVS
jgi:peptidoglycan/LPS O-acetylase OafA/YrhL